MSLHLRSSLAVIARRIPRRSRPTWLAFIVCATLMSCASSSGGGAGRPKRVTLIDYQKNARFELVNQAHTDPFEYYSTKRTDASRKIVNDDVMSALIADLDDLGFASHNQSGEAPAEGRGQWTRGLEIQDADGVLHLATGGASAAAERKTMVDCTVLFLAHYQDAQSFQAIDNTAGSSFFEQSKSR